MTRRQIGYCVCQGQATPFAGLFPWLGARREMGPSPASPQGREKALGTRFQSLKNFKDVAGWKPRDVFHLLRPAF